MTSILLASILCALPQRPPPQPAQATAQPQLTDDEIRERILTYMGAIDTPIGPERWRELGARGSSILEQMAQDPAELPTHRAKAVDGIAAIASPAAPGLILALAKSDQAPLVVRLAAVRGAAAVLPQGQLVPALQPLLEGARNGHLRKVAAEVLSEHGGCHLVRAQARREDEPARMERALKSCGE